MPRTAGPCGKSCWRSPCCDSAPMPGGLAQRVEVWAREPAPNHINLVAEVMEWSQRYGDDIEHAWSECHRADFLVVLAGLRHEPIAPALALACRGVRGASRAIVPVRQSRTASE